MKYKYLAQTYKQGTSEMELVSFCANATEIKKWGGVPTKAAIFHGGFQRALSPRFKKIVKYFNDGQASPTGIVVAFREGMLKIDRLSYPKDIWPNKDTLSNPPELAIVSFDIDETQETASIKELCEKVCALLKPRLERSAATITEQESGEEEGEELQTKDGEIDANANANESEGADDEEEDFDVGHSKLKLFFSFISDYKKVEDWIKEKDSKDRSDEIRGVLLSLLRPAMIVDGQHRVFGAYGSDRASEISFTVNAIKDADWVEQVFQFVVLNKLAKPISPLFLTSLLNTSLTNYEVSDIEGRLENIGIKNTDRKIMKYLNHDNRSPFFDQITEPGEMAGMNNSGRLPDKGMISLAKRWKSLLSDKKEIQMFQAAIDAKNITQARESWKKYETWLPYFYGFWDTLKAKYQAQSVWEKADGYFLLYMVTMSVMQDLFIVSKSKGDARFKSIEDFKEQVSLFYDEVPAAFFMGWKRKGNQTPQGVAVIKSALEDLRSGTRLKTVQDTSELFKELTKLKK